MGIPTKTNLTMAESDQQIVDKVKAALDTAIGILNDKDGWKVEKEKGGATIKSKKNAEGRKVWMCEVQDGLHIMAGCSVNLADQPEVSGRVRAVHGPGCQTVKAEGDGCRFTWLMDCDYRGLIPGSVVELAMPAAQLQMVECIMGLA